MLKIITELKSFIEYRNSLQGKIGLVPTMGNLHRGHLDLFEQSLKDNDITIVSIFVNPKQFLAGEDLDKYPRTFEDDLNHLKGLMKDNDQVILFHPKNDHEIYGEYYHTTIRVEAMANTLCGKFRPGHFDGVTTVVYRLFALTKPTIAYFGQKDFQQLMIIKKMVSDLLLDLEIVMIPIRRDGDGLAMSSRNRYLDREQRELGLLLPKTLEQLEAKLQSEELHKVIEQAREISSQDASWQYLEILDASNLLPPHDATEQVVIAGAFLVGSTRLIDNRLVKLTRVK